MTEVKIKLNYLQVLKYILYTGVLLYFGRTVFIPLAYGVFVSFLLYPVVKWLEEHKIPGSAAILISLTMLVIAVAALLLLLGSQAVSFGSRWPDMQLRLNSAFNSMMDYLRTHTGFSPGRLDRQLDNMLDKVGSQLIGIFGGLIYFSATSMVMIFLVPVYAALILSMRKYLLRFLFRFFSDEDKQNVLSMLHEVVYTFYRFIKGMATVYLIVGTLNSIGLYFLGIPNPLLFGFIASVLTFIPYIGIIAGSLLPVSIAWAMHDNIWYGLGVIAVFAFVQFLEANLIFPLAVSYRLKVSTFFTIIAIFTGGVCWGMSGMILFIPALGIAKMVMDKVPQLKPYAEVLEG
jgi:predicted PurR-regulated permease PerM